ncbi:serine/threonine-protein phosphatase 6 regulatory ankyrin repeat subunit B [Halyomorpha halys]|uniref:serine/threonine-protein phosphatase 6 regulatory ankyrin repeat subunit B n=1 Tax=Halyomorpha halys TaxID=286706 RepID=UPI0006D4DAF5|nr:serine/threonine-protein phosphatase 6 regulatory ankyrin repeat subunit B-like [Halyomorpha halys]
MLRLLQLTIFILISPKMDTISQTTNNYNNQYNIQEEFRQMFDESKKDVISQGAEFILSSIENSTWERLPPMTLGQYCLLQTIWALAYGQVELAQTFVNKTLVCYDSTSKDWLENLDLDQSLMFAVVKSTSEMNQGNDILKEIAVSLSRSYNVLIEAAERGDDSLIIWLKEAGIDFTEIGYAAISSAWIKDHTNTVKLLLEMGNLGNSSVGDAVGVSNSKGETLLHFAAGRGLKLLVEKLLDNGAEIDKKDVNSLTPLYHAVRANEKEIVRLLLKRGADLQIRSKNGNTLLHLAVMENNTITLSGLLEFGLDVDTENYKEIPPLFLAAERGYNSLIDLLIKRGADPNFKSSSGNALLHIAVSRGSLTAVKNLIKHGALVDSKNSEKLTPLYLAANLGKPDLIWFLLNKGAARHDPESRESLLHIAAQRGDMKAIESLVNLCISVDELNQNGVTPLYSAASAGKREAMGLLLAKGADLYITLSNGQRLLHVAVEEGNVVAIELLLDVGIYVDVKDTEILTALCRAVQNDNIVTVALLIEKGANTSYRTSVGDTLLHLAAVSNSHESIQLLVEHGLHIDAENDQNETPLYIAAKNNNTNTANLLITLGANKNYVTSIGGTLAHLAAIRDDFIALKTLFNIGVDFNAIDKNGSPPLYAAIQKSEVRAANTMIESGVDLFFIDEHNDSLLHIAGRNKHHNVIEFLIDRGIYIDSQGSNGSRPVDVALYEGHCDTAEYFMEKGANIRGRNGMNWTVLHSAVIGDCSSFLRNIAVRIDNIDPKDQNMRTPLHLAAVLGRNEIANTLILLGADVNSPDEYNFTPFQIAAVNRNWDMVSSFVKEDVNLDWTDAHNRTLLHLATIDNRYEIVIYLKEKMRMDTYVQDVDGRIPLHLAAEKGWDLIISSLTDERVPESLDYRDHEGKTPLHLAAINGHKSAVEYLLNKGADPQSTDSHRKTPLIYSAKHHHWNVAKQLLSKTCTSANDTDEEKRTILHLAVLDGQIDFISSYYQCFNKIINNKDSKDRTPLDVAIEMERRDIVRSFLQYYWSTLKFEDCIALNLEKVGELSNVVESLSAIKASSKCRDDKNRTLLHSAAWHGDEDTVRSLLENRMNNLDAMDVDNRTALHLAVIQNRHVIVRLLLEHGARKDIKDKNQMNPLTVALSNKIWDSALELLDNESDIGWSDTYNRTLLHYAAVNGQEKIIEYLLKHTKMDVNAKDINFDTPLQLVAVQSNLSSYNRQGIMDRFVRNGAEWDLLDKQNRNILHLVTISGDAETLKHVLSRYRLDVNSRDINLQTPLHIAIIERHYHMVNTLLEYGADRNEVDINHFMPLVYAIKNRFDAVDLFDKFTDVNWADNNNRSILHLAAMHGCSGVVRKLLNSVIKKINIDRLDINKQTSLHLAAKENDNEIVHLLIREGADGYHLDKNDHSPLNLAVMNNSWIAVKALVMSGFYEEYRYDRNRTLLHLAIMNSLRDLTDYLINDIVTDLTATDDLGDTPLHIAARKNDHITVGKLLEKGVEKDVLNAIGENPLMVAMVNDGWEAVGVLLKGNCDVDGMDRNNRTILHLAAMNGKTEIISQLFSCSNVNINALDSYNETALDLLLKNQNIYSTSEYSGVNWRDGKGRTLLHLGLSTLFNHNVFYNLKTVDPIDKQRQTPLHIAVMNDYPYEDKISWLLDRGASINAVDINGHSPLHLAVMYGHESIIRKILHNYGAYIPYEGENELGDYEETERNEKMFNLRLNAKDLLGRTPLQLSLDHGHKEIATLLELNGATI